MPSVKGLASALLIAAAGSKAQLEDCWGYSGLIFPNNTVCPGSNSCCGPSATRLSNRLCHDPDDGADTFIRGPCSVRSYDSGTCAKLCLYDEDEGVLPRVRRCSQDGSLCCDNDPDCCSEGRGRFLDNDGQFADVPPSTTYSWGPERTEEGFRTATTDTTTSAASSTTGAASTTQPTSSSPASDDNGGNGNDDSLKIGLGVGIPVGCVVIAAVALWILWRRRRRAAGPADPSTGTVYEASNVSPMKTPGGYSPWIPDQNPSHAVEMESPQQHNTKTRSFAEMEG